MRKLILLLFIVLASVSVSLAQKTTVYFVRHAEKNMIDPSSKDPELSGDGVKRTQDLVKFLRKEKIAAVFSTNYKRTIQTADPVAKKANKEVIIYDAGKIAELVHKVTTEYKGKTVLIVGHSNTVLPMVKAFGGSTNLIEIKDYEYNYLFRVVIDGDKVVTTQYTYGD
ncbi:MAG TPA: histidine phosphatase family protein [Chitinophagaceae bacterium]|nr:histidine phosphatase family protein [Chitinophagaceae bacterium]